MDTLSPTRGHAPETRHPGVALALLGVFLMVVQMDNTILNMALRAIQQDLGATNAQLQWAVDAYILTEAALMYSTGVLADRFGRKRILLIGLAIFTVTSALLAFAQSPGQVIIWRAIMGIGGAVVAPATLSIIQDSFPADRRGMAMGVWAAIGGSAVAFGPIIGGVMLEWFWWGSVFLLNVPVVIIAGMLALWAVPESRAAVRHHLDPIGIALTIAGTSLLVFGVIRGGETTRWLRWDTLGVALAGLIVLTAFVLLERTRPEPMLDVTLFRSRAFSSATLSAALSVFTITGGTYLLVFYNLIVRADTTFRFGLILLPFAVASIAAALAADPLQKATGARLAVTSGLVFQLAAFVMIGQLTVTSPLLTMEIALMLGGIGVGIVMASTTTLAMTTVPQEKAAAGAAANTTIRQVGAALGVAVLGSIYATHYRTSMADVLAPFMPPLPAQAAESLAATATSIEQALRTAGPEMQRSLGSIMIHAQRTFTASMQWAFTVAIVILALTMVVGLVWLPGKGRQEGQAAPG